MVVGITIQAKRYDLSSSASDQERYAMFIRRVFFICIAMLAGHSALGAETSTTRTVSLLEKDGTRHSIGSITFEANKQSGPYIFELDSSAFSDHFLSMRPFKCLEGPEKHWCHVPYPYAIRRSVSAEDLTDLEYDFLFIWKGATEYGINMWNGVFYRLEQENGRIVGQLHEVDMDLLSVPPAEGDFRPLLAKDLHEADPDSHWLPELVIE